MSSDVESGVSAKQPLAIGHESSNEKTIKKDPSSSPSSSSWGVPLLLLTIVAISATFLMVFFFVFVPQSDSSTVEHVDSSAVGVQSLNDYFGKLKADFMAFPDENVVYSDMSREGGPMFSGYEPENVKAAMMKKFPDISKVNPDRYIISASALEEDENAKWGLLHANVRGHYNQSVLLSPDHLRAILNFDDSEDDATGSDDAFRKNEAPSGGSTSSDIVNSIPQESIDSSISNVKSNAAVTTSSSFNWDEAMSSLYHAETCYCDEDTYMTRTYGGVLSGFVPTYHISNRRLDTAGYIGYHSAENVIYVSFRGSASLNNWITTNLDVDTVPYPRCDGCRLHSGFYEAALAVFPEVLAEVQRLRILYPFYKVIVTGHSLGGALSHITALELEAYGISNLELYTFGSPRVTNTDMAEYSTNKLPTASRVTHDKDLVVHTPGSIFFTHMAGEWHQPGDEVEVIECFGFEDESCSYQYVFTSVADHMEYLGVAMGEDGCAAVTYD